MGYHGARYYASWLGRWVAVDPRGMVDGVNTFAYSRNSPVRRVDPGGRESGEAPQLDKKATGTSATTQTAKKVGGGTTDAEGGKESRPRSDNLMVRGLTEDEIKTLKPIFGDTIDYSKVTIKRDTLLSKIAQITTGNTIHLPSGADWGPIFKKNSQQLTPEGKKTLVHEMAHVQQWQTGERTYALKSLWAQVKAIVKAAMAWKPLRYSRNEAYDWVPVWGTGRRWNEWNPEQRAQALEEFYAANRDLRKVAPKPESRPTVEVLQGYMEQVRGLPGQVYPQSNQP